MSYGRGPNQCIQPTAKSAARFSLRFFRRLMQNVSLFNYKKKFTIMQKNEKWLPIFLVVVAFIIAGYSIFISSQRTLTSLEETLLQAFMLVSGLVGSFYLGKQSAADAAKQIIKPHARSAFRRLISLYESLSRVGVEIGNSKETQSEALTIAKMEAIIVEQLATADDALEDWRDIVPEEVEELRNKLKTKRDHGDQK